MKRIKFIICLLVILTITSMSITYAQGNQNIYSNGSKFKVLRYVYTDLNENIINRNDNVKQTTFIIDAKNRLFTVKMADIYYERYYYNKVDRVTKNGTTIDMYGVYKSYSSEDKNKPLSDVLMLEINPTNNALKTYKLYFGDKGFITFYLSPI